MYLNDSTGKKSLTATLSIIAFVIVMLKLLVNNSGIQIGGFSYSFGSIGSAEIASILGPILGTYAFRRYTDKRYGSAGDLEADPEVGDPGASPGDGNA